LHADHLTDKQAAIDALKADHAAEVERLTADRDNRAQLVAERDFLRTESDRLERDFNTASLATELAASERDAAVARAEKAEEALRRISNGEVEVFDEDEGCNVLVAMDEEEMQDIARAALAAAPDHIGGVTEMVAPDKHPVRQGSVACESAFDAHDWDKDPGPVAPDKPHYAALENVVKNKGDVIVKLKGVSRSFRCLCGCDVFREFEKNHYRCNSCGETFTAE
jgi:hypothetical protein